MFFCCFCPCCPYCCCCCCCFSVYRGWGDHILDFHPRDFWRRLLSTILVPKQLVTNALVVMCEWESRNVPLCSFQPWQQKWNIHKTKYLKEGTVEMATYLHEISHTRWAPTWRTLNLHKCTTSAANRELRFFPSIVIQFGLFRRFFN